MFEKIGSFLLAVFLVITVGCSLTSTVTPDQIAQDKFGLLAIKNSARAFGYAISNTKSDLDDTVVLQAYGFFKSGNVDPVELNKIISPFAKNSAYKLVVLAGFDLLEAMGATITDGQIMDTSKISPELWSIVEKNYNLGYELGKSDKTRGITRSIP